MKDYLCFKGKTAVVTGSTRGIGKAIADILFKLGCYVIVTGTREDGPPDSSTQEYWPLDLSQEESLSLFCRRLKALKRLDILINNAGINVIESVEELSLKHWERIIKVNLTGAMRLIQEAIPQMKKNKGGGRILNISSILGLISKMKRSAYSASKAGLIGLTRASALDAAKDNILINALCPGFTLTDLTRNVLSEKEREELAKEIPLGRLAGESEIANFAVFLCSDLNTYMTGQTITVDGGFVIQ